MTSSSIYVLKYEAQNDSEVWLLSPIPEWGLRIPRRPCFPALLHLTPLSSCPLEQYMDTGHIPSPKGTPSLNKAWRGFLPLLPLSRVHEAKDFIQLLPETTGPRWPAFS